MNGLRPICEFMTFNFSLVAIDQVINAAAKINSMSNGQYLAPMVFRGPTGSAGQLAQQHSQNFENWYANTPGLKVVVPSNPADAKGLLKSAIRDENPVIFMESEQMYGFKGMIPEGEYTIPIGVADVVKEGKDVTIVSFGKMMLRAHTAVEELAKEGIDAELIDLRTVRPIDYDTVIRSVQKTNRLVIVEEAWPLASISSEISHIVQRRAFDYLDAPVHRVTSMDTSLPYAGVFVDAYLPSVERIVKAVKAVTYKG
jgi:pyruvate dehydrogenase E1 component beta subunit